MDSAPHILHVDDDPDLLDLVAHRFEQGGVELSTATTADAALAHLRDNPVDCVVLDSLRLDDGEPLVSAVRRVDGDVPIVLFTGQSWSAVADVALRADVVEYVQKGPPTAMSSLVTRVRALIEMDDPASLDAATAAVADAMGVDDAVAASSVALGAGELGSAWTVVAEFDFDDTRELDAVVLEALDSSAAVGLDSAEPLYETIDADALSMVLRPRVDGERRTDVQVRFPYAGYEIAVTGTGVVAIREVDPADSA